MKIGYIRETEEKAGFLQKLNLYIKKALNIIDIKETNGRNIYYLPISKTNKVSTYRIKRVSKKLVKLLENEGIHNIVISKYLNKDKFKIYLYSQDVNILDGKYLFKCLIYYLLEYIFNIKEKQMEFGEVTLLINDFDSLSTELIIFIAKNIKRLNIVTNHIEKCKKIEEYLYDEFGIMLNVSNNKKSSLLKSELIVNIDFPEEILNKYKIYDKAIILNILEKVTVKSIRFNGINVSNYKIIIPEEDKLNEFEDEIVYESLIYSYKELNSIMKKIDNDKVKIEALIGNNGFINENELK